MDEHKDMHDHPHHHGLLKSRLVMKLFAVFLLVATIFVGAKAVNAIVNFDAVSVPPSNVITVTGEGKVSAAPDIATISFTISEDADTSAQAQDAAAKKVNVALALLKNLKIADKDIKTSSYNISPRYSQPTPCYSGGPCTYSQTVIGFTVSESVEVKVRAIDDSGKVLSALGEAGVSNLYGPNFSVENPDELKSQARKEAVAKARAQAKSLASDLGVRLVRIVNYSEGGGYPIYYAKAADMAMGSGATPPRPEVSVPTGENEIVVNVSVTYEIR